VRQDPTQQQWLKNNVEPQKQSDAHNEKGIFKKDIKEFLNPGISCTSTAKYTQDVPR
jgi:hypothetical protein